MSGGFEAGYLGLNNADTTALSAGTYTVTATDVPVVQDQRHI